MRKGKGYIWNPNVSSRICSLVPFFRTRRCLRVVSPFSLFSPLKECQLKVFVTFVNCQVDVTRGRRREKAQKKLKKREILSFFNTCPDTWKSTKNRKPKVGLSEWHDRKTLHWNLQAMLCLFFTFEPTGSKSEIYNPTETQSILQHCKFLQFSKERATFVRAKIAFLLCANPLHI